MLLHAPHARILIRKSSRYFLSPLSSLVPPPPSSPSYTYSFRSDSSSFGREAFTSTRTNKSSDQETLSNQAQVPWTA
ncbi:hypothetical protein J3F84DRAFT_385573 [Trichoderma pleuroticola]